jgi:cytochrome c oxidase assembly protein subunit 15
MSPSYSALARTSAALVACTLFLIVFGASVRVHGAGLACPDWPLCFGEVIPPIDFGVALEFGHRVLAGSISLVFAGVLGRVWWRRDELGALPVRLGLAAAVVLVIQVVLGGLTVLELLAEWTVTSHLLAGNTFCMLLLLLTLAIREHDVPVQRAPIPRAVRWAFAAMALALPVQLALGGLVASSYAGLACGTWPTCDGTSWFPTFSGLVGLQLVHRLVAYGLAAIATVGLVVTRGRGRVGRAAVLMFVLVWLQGAIGVANVLMRLPVEVTLAHSLGAATLWLATAWANWEALRAPVAVDAPAVHGAPALEAK